MGATYDNKNENIRVDNLWEKICQKLYDKDKYIKKNVYTKLLFIVLNISSTKLELKNYQNRKKKLYFLI